MLIVEDDAAIRDALVQLFREEGYDVDAVVNGQCALEWLQRGSVLPDLILSDVTMPVMDGLELVERLQAHERFRTIPIVLMSACRIPDSATHVRDLPVLRKPFAVDTALRVIKQYAANGRGARRRKASSRTPRKVGTTVGGAGP